MLLQVNCVDLEPLPGLIMHHQKAPNGGLIRHGIGAGKLMHYPNIGASEPLLHEYAA